MAERKGCLHLKKYCQKKKLFFVWAGALHGLVRWLVFLTLIASSKVSFVFISGYLRMLLVPGALHEQLMVLQGGWCPAQCCPCPSAPPAPAITLSLWIGAVFPLGAQAQPPAPTRALQRSEHFRRR